MNQINTHNLKIADTLKSLSATPVQAPTQGGRRNTQWYALGIGLTAIVAVSGFAIMNWPALMDRAELEIPNQATIATPGPETPLIQSPLTQAVLQESIPLAASIAPVQEISGSGYVVAPHATAVFAKYGGTLTDILVDVGDHVVAGAILAQLEDTNARFALEQAQAALVSANLELAARAIAFEHAQNILDRTTELVARNVASGQQLDDASNALQVAQNAVAQADQNVALAQLGIRIARESVDALTLHAPIAGTVTALNATVGDTMLGRTDSQSLLAITNTNALFIDADIAEANIALLHAGQRGEAVLDGFPDQPFPIVLTRIAPEVSAAKGTVTVRLSFDAPPTGTRPNMAARIRIFATQPDAH